jgi:RNA polymerase sigma-70 factor (ECF subfamily)
VTCDVDRTELDLAPALRRMLPAGWERSMRPRERAEFDDVVAGAWRVVYYRVAQRVSDRREAEELAQEVFCRVLSRLATLPADREVRRSYLAMAAQNLLYDHWRRRDRARMADLAFAGDPSSEDGPFEDDVLSRLPSEELRAALETLPALHRQVLRLRIVEGLTAEEVGAVVGRRADTVRQVQHRALAALRAVLDRRRSGLPDGAGSRSPVP